MSCPSLWGTYLFTYSPNGPVTWCFGFVCHATPTQDPNKCYVLLNGMIVKQEVCETDLCIYLDSSVPISQRDFWILVFSFSKSFPLHRYIAKYKRQEKPRLTHDLSGPGRRRRPLRPTLRGEKRSLRAYVPSTNVKRNLLLSESDRRRFSLDVWFWLEKASKGRIVENTLIKF